MLISTSLLLVCSAVAAVVAAPTDEYTGGKRIVRVPFKKVARPNGHRLTKRDPFQTTLYNDDGSQYLITVNIGTPAQTFTVALDTGSADLWVPSSSCPTSVCPYAKFDSSKSSTFNATNEVFGIVYGSGSANGTYVKDTVTIAGATVANQQFGLVTQTKDILTNQGSLGGGVGSSPSVSQNSSTVSDGIFGLGYPQLTAATSDGGSVYNPFVFNLVAQKTISDPVFSIYLNSVSATGNSGEIIFGGVDQSKYTGELAYMPVAPLTSGSSNNPLDNIFGTSGNTQVFAYWMVYGQGFTVTNGASTPNITMANTVPVILDTGTTLTYLPQSVAQQIALSVASTNSIALDSAAGVYVVECSVANTNAQVQVQFSTSDKVTTTPVTFSVPVSQLVIPLDTNSASTASQCIFGIAPSSTGGSTSSDLYLIGDSMLRSAYMVFDMGQNRVGLAAANGVGGSVNGNAASSSSSAAAMTSTPVISLIVTTSAILVAMLM
ncbi:aspartic peptidase domain-containing protein [Umbelopsis sp. PMI_123]|nr:aspartic peptidase domain-containing protein [Umbelopsis sp. PMI_123]